MKRVLLCGFLIGVLFSVTNADERILSSNDATNEWTGGTRNDAVKVKGSASLKWIHRDHDQVTLNKKNLNLSTHKSLRFHIHSNRATNGGIVMILSSENEATEDQDYYSLAIHLNFIGWKTFLVPRAQFGTNRAPRGWDQIDQISFRANGWGNTPNPDVVLHIDDMVLTNDMPQGPVMTKAQFFSLFKNDVPGLQAFHKAVAKNDFDQAQKQLASYYRTRTSVPWTFDPHMIDRSISFNKQRADNAVKAHISVIGLPHAYPDSTIDWQYNLTFDRADLANNNEWGVQLNRMSFWRDLGRAYWATGDEKYAQAFARQLRDWIAQCPRPNASNSSFAPAWRTIEAGIRLTSTWMISWHRFLQSPSLTDEDLTLFLMSIVEQAQHLREHPSRGNWLAHEMGGLYTAGGLFPELKEATDWRTFAIDKMHHALTDQFLPDGAQIELTPGYHRITCSYILGIYQRAQLFDRTDELPPGFVEGLENAYVYLVGLMTPNRSLPRFNDSWDNNLPRTFRNVYPVFPNQKAFEWVATNGERGTMPNFTSTLFPYAGYAIMRTGWEEDATYVGFDGGLPGYGHIHFDKLNMILWSHGREILYDGGGGQYETSKWRRYATSTLSHNTVIVDGLPQRSNTRNRRKLVPTEPVSLVWQTTKEYDYVAAAYDGGYGQSDNHIARHQRQLLFIKPDIILVEDRLTSQDQKSHTYEARWHVNSTQTNHQNQTVTTTDPNQPNLAIVSLFPVQTNIASAQEKPDLRGWWVKRNGPMPTTTISHTISGKGDQRILTLLKPLKTGQTPDIQSVEKTGRLTSKVTFNDGQILTIQILDNEAIGLIVTKQSPNGEPLKKIAVSDVLKPK